MRAIGVLFGFLVGFAIAAAGCYLGVWIMLVGGVVDIINQVKLEKEQVDATVIGIAIAKILFCELPIVFGIWGGIICGSILATVLGTPRRRQTSAGRFVSKHGPYF